MWWLLEGDYSYYLFHEYVKAKQRHPTIRQIQAAEGTFEEIYQIFQACSNHRFKGWLHKGLRDGPNAAVDDN